MIYARYPRSHRAHSGQTAAGRTAGAGRSGAWFDGAWVVGLGVAGALMLFCVWGLRLQQSAEWATQRSSLQQSVAMAASLVQADVAQALAVADTLELVIRSTGQVEAFDKVAQDLMLRNPLVTTIGLAPGGVIRQVAPLEGQAGLIGRRMHEDAAVRADLTEAMRKRAMVVSLPQALMGGGVGVVGRLPVFRPGADADAAPALWGFVLVQIKLPDVAARLAAAGVGQAEGRFRLSALDVNTGNRIAFYPFPAPKLEAGEAATIQLPHKQWTLTVEARPQDAGASRLALSLSALASAAVGLLCAWLLRRRRLMRARRDFFRHSVPGMPWDDGLDEAHRALEITRRCPGWAALLVVSLPPRQSPARRAPLLDALRSMLREQDLLVPLGESAYLVLAHSLPDRSVADSVCLRLASPCRDPQLAAVSGVQQRVLLQPQADVRQVFAELMAEANIDQAARSLRGVPDRGGVVLPARFGDSQAA